MTAPADLASLPAITAITARIQAIQSRIASFAPGAATATTGTSASQFAATLAATTPTTATTVAGSTGGVTGQAVVDTASKYLGVPYVWGGESDSGLDCSGLVQKTFGDLGIKLPRTAAEQQDVGTPVASLSQAQPGDLVFFGDPAYHVAIYAGNNQIIESPEPGKTVHRVELTQTPTNIRRMDGVGTGIGTTAGVTAVGAPGGTIPSGVSAKVAAYASEFAAVEQQRGLPAGLLAAVAQQESGGNAAAVSPAGAQGLMQIMPATAAGMGINPLDPQQAINAAGRILARNLHEFGTVPLALAAYNAGAGAVQRYGGIPPYSETQNYVRRIMNTMGAAA